MFRKFTSRKAGAGGSSTDFQEFEREALVHLEALMAFARRLTRNQAEAEDLVQDTFVKALRARDQYETGTNLRAWLLRILRNTFINRYHRGALEKSVTTGPLADPVSDAWISAATMRATRDAEGQVLKPELARHISAAIDRLPEEFRTVVLLADVEEFAYKEIAETLGCPIGTVMSRLHRARKLLKGALLQQARDSGLISPEAMIGETNDTSSSAEPRKPIDLSSYRERIAGGGSR